jgi:hypothetical protein
VTPADLRLRLLATLANEWAVADEGHAEFIFTNLSGAVEAAYVHGVAVTRTETLRWLLTAPTEPDPDPEPETHDRP